MGRRLLLHAELIALLGSNNVYFQPPPTVKMKYPCIVYRRSPGNTKYSANMPYLFRQSYEVTVIDPDPDSPLIEKMATGFPMIRHDRHFESDNLNHDVYSLYY